MPTHKVTNEVITAAILGFEEQKRRIDLQISELLSTQSGGSGETADVPGVAPRKRKISAASRRRMALGQKARWAKIKGESAPLARGTTEPPKPKRKLSKAGKAAIVAALKKRWALKRAGVAKERPTPTKKAPQKKAAE